MRKVKILTNGYIMPITMDGPIVSPIVVDDKTAFDLVRRGYDVVEVSQFDGSIVKLTTANFNDANRFSNLIPEKPVFTPTGSAVNGVATPVVPVSSNITSAPTPNAISNINESKNLTRAERKAKRRAEEAARKAAEAAEVDTPATEEVAVEETAEVPATEEVVETTEE